MGIEIGAQLDALWRALFLGAAFALLYDGLRALRLRRFPAAPIDTWLCAMEYAPFLRRFRPAARSWCGRAAKTGQ